MEQKKRHAQLAADPRVQAMKQALAERRRAGYEQAKQRRKAFAEEQKTLARERAFAEEQKTLARERALAARRLRDAELGSKVAPATGPESSRPPR